MKNEHNDKQIPTELALARIVVDEEQPPLQKLGEVLRSKPGPCSSSVP